uniref:Uncharacterized protein n=1 Tax=Plectus sambesii TaxID=2011161 RepID=A0A914X655_9BILA
MAIGLVDQQSVSQWSRNEEPAAIGWRHTDARLSAIRPTNDCIIVGRSPTRHGSNWLRAGGSI